jgi:GntR family transcriptional repressor for pyruvate dehydrogenase complex
MTTDPMFVSRHRLPEQVFASLFNQIIDGAVAPGQALPPERTLAEQYGVNRQVVREAVKRLVHLGLVSATQGDGNRVRNWRLTGNFELITFLAARAGAGTSPLDAELARSLLDIRVAIGVDTSRLCAERAGPETFDELDRLVCNMHAVTGVAEQLAVRLSFWNVVIDGADNLCYRLLMNTITSSVMSFAVLLGHHSGEVPGTVEQYATLVAAMRRRDPGLAEAAARTLMTGRPIVPPGDQLPIEPGTERFDGTTVTQRSQPADL